MAGRVGHSPTLSQGEAGRHRRHREPVIRKADEYGGAVRGIRGLDLQIGCCPVVLMSLLGNEEPTNSLC